MAFYGHRQSESPIELRFLSHPYSTCMSIKKITKVTGLTVGEFWMEGRGWWGESHKREGEREKDMGKGPSKTEAAVFFFFNFVIFCEKKIKNQQLNTTATQQLNKQKK